EPPTIHLACAVIPEDRGCDRRAIGEDKIGRLAVCADETGGEELMLVAGEARVERLGQARDHHDKVLADPLYIAELGIAKGGNRSQLSFGIEYCEPALTLQTAHHGQALATRRDRHILDAWKSAIRVQ